MFSKKMTVVFVAVFFNFVQTKSFSKWASYYEWVEETYADKQYPNLDVWKEKHISFYSQTPKTDNRRIIFLIPVAFRGPNVNYYNKTIHGLLREFGAFATIHVFHNTPRTNLLGIKSIIEHPFNSAKRAQFEATHPPGKYSFANRNNDWILPKHKVHNFDIAFMLSHVSVVNDYDILSVVEDDMVACKGSAKLFFSILEHAEKTSKNQWAAIRTSSGANGIFFPSWVAPILSEYIASQRRIRIIDNILLEFYNSESPQSALTNKEKLHYVSRHNLFEHIGFVSTYGQARTNALKHLKEQVVCYTPVDSRLAGWLHFDFINCFDYPASPCLESFNNLNNI